ncbi:hypothetical protein C8J27_106111 [Rhodobacter aestuarii]|uniref:Uncharacterized protein n=2 Tax=Rhodobacter aestuarii TaxID=453582 RepID=A0A1N7M514_9RHOB|nr:hypothetical protein C8J27_106111 [Rhodobacter aestuarii]SIS81041.1 hypothetical protein SAMN05421580_105111 [Rhodobacter aestuarii]
MQTQHLFLIPPMFDTLGSAVARSLAQGQGRLVAAGYGMAALGPVEGAGVIVDQAIFGRAGAGLKGFFPLAGARARAMAEMLDGPVGRIVVPMMALDQAYPMLWRQQAIRRVMPDFDGLGPKFCRFKRGWAEVVEDLIAAFAPEEVVVLHAPVSSAQVLSALVPDAGLAAIEPVSNVIPDTAIAMLQRLYRQGVEVPPKQVMRMIEQHQHALQPAPLAQFAPEDRAEMRRHFATEMERLAAMPHVRIGLDGLDFANAAQ